MKSIRLAGAFVTGLSLVACGGGLQKGSDLPSASANDPGYVSPADYPAGPYGYAVRSTIADLTFLARVDASMKGDSNPGVTQAPGAPNISTYPVQKIHFADYRKNFKVLVINASAQWCPHCMDEQPDFKANYQRWNANGPKVGVLEVIVQDTSGRPAGMDIADQWARAYGLNFDIGADPTGVLSPYYDINAFPMNMVIKATDMTIQWSSNGNNDVGLSSAVDYALSH